MFFPIFLRAVIGALAGAFFRFESREKKHGWLTTAALAAVALVLFQFTPGQEFFGFWYHMFAFAAAGALLCGAVLRLRK